MIIIKPDDYYLTPEQAMKLIGLSKSAFYRLKDDKNFPSATPVISRVGGKKRANRAVYIKDEILAWKEKYYVKKVNQYK